MTDKPVPSEPESASKERRKETDAVPELTTQFFVTLRATYARVRPAEPTPVQTAACKEIERLFQTETWLNAYEIEQRLVGLFDADTVDLTLKGRNVEAKGKLSADALDLYKKGEEEADVKKRSWLARIIDDLQWHYTIEEVKRGYARTYSRFTNNTFLVTMGLFCALLLVGSLSRTPVHQFVFACAAGLWGASFSMLIGLKSRIQNASFDDMKVMVKWPFLLSRVCIGLGAGAILYLLLSSGLVAGQVFPDFTKETLQKEQLIADLRDAVQKRVGIDSDATVAKINAAMAKFSTELGGVTTPGGGGLADAVSKPIEDLSKRIAKLRPGIDAEQLASELSEQLSKRVDETSLLHVRNLALLLVWCFLAGFSETLVPNLLAAAEAESAKKKS